MTVDREIRRLVFDQRESAERIVFITRERLALAEETHRQAVALRRASLEAGVSIEALLGAGDPV